MPPSFDRFCDVLTTVATLKADVSKGKARACVPGPSGSLESCFRNAKKLLYLLAEIKTCGLDWKGTETRCLHVRCWGQCPSEQPRAHSRPFPPL